MTSVTGVYYDSEKLEFGRSYESVVTTSPGMTKQLLIVNANSGIPLLVRSLVSRADPLVFGGPDFSVARANEFDPTRPQEELDKILTFNGLFPEVPSLVSCFHAILGSYQPSLSFLALSFAICPSPCLTCRWMPGVRHVGASACILS